MQATSRDSRSSLANYDRAFLLPPCGQRCGQLRPSIEGIAALAGLDLDELGGEVDPSAATNRVTASRWASIPSPDRALAGGGNAVVGNSLLQAGVFPAESR